MSKRKGAVPGDSGADAAVSPSGKSDESDVKVIPNERLERARAKKYDIPYDPEHTASIKSYVKWKRENHRLMLARARTHDKSPRPAKLPGSDYTWTLKPGDTIKRTVLHERFGGSGQSGIRER